MHRTIYYQQNQRGTNRFGWLYFILGGNLILLSVLIFIFPEILAFLFGGMLLVGGIAIIAIGFGFRKWSKLFTGKYRTIKVE